MCQLEQVVRRPGQVADFAKRSGVGAWAPGEDRPRPAAGHVKNLHGKRKTYTVLDSSVSSMMPPVRQRGLPVVALLLPVLVCLLPLAQASPPDPTWIAGLYDGGDYDEAVLVLTSLQATVPALDVTTERPAADVLRVSASRGERAVRLGLPPLPGRAPPAPRSPLGGTATLAVDETSGAGRA